MNLENKIKLHNKFEVKVLDLNGNVKSEQVAYNVVLDAIYAFRASPLEQGRGCHPPRTLSCSLILAGDRWGKSTAGRLKKKETSRFSQGNAELRSMRMSSSERL